MSTSKTLLEHVFGIDPNRSSQEIDGASTSSKTILATALEPYIGQMKADPRLYRLDGPSSFRNLRAAERPEAEASSLVESLSIGSWFSGSSTTTMLTQKLSEIVRDAGAGHLLASNNGKADHPLQAACVSVVASDVGTAASARKAASTSPLYLGPASSTPMPVRLGRPLPYPKRTSATPETSTVAPAVSGSPVVHTTTESFNVNSQPERLSTASTISSSNATPLRQLFGSKPPSAITSALQYEISDILSTEAIETHASVVIPRLRSKARTDPYEATAAFLNFVNDIDNPALTLALRVYMAESSLRHLVDSDAI